MNDAAQPVGIVIAHGTMAAGLVDAVRRIAGSSADALVPISNDGKSSDDLRAAVDEAAGTHPAVVFVDLQAGSCCVAALASSRLRADRAVLTGVNLPMLLEFVFQRGMDRDELADRLVARSREAIGSLAPGGVPGGQR
jgi:mannose/fructose-specific phosphotransferase system component IIA